MKKNKIKGISKAIYIISKINLVILGIAATAIMLMMAVSPLLISKTEVTDSTVSFFDEEFDYSIKEGEIKIDGKALDYSIEEKVDDVASFFQKENKLKTTLIAEFALALALATLALLYLALLNLYKLFKNIYDEETPFNEKNINHINGIAKYILLSLIVSMVGGLLLGIFMGFHASLNINITEILAVLIIYALSVIFEYGYKLQQEIDSTL